MKKVFKFFSAAAFKQRAQGAERGRLLAELTRLDETARYDRSRRAVVLARLNTINRESLQVDDCLPSPVWGFVHRMGASALLLVIIGVVFGVNS